MQDAEILIKNQNNRKKKDRCGTDRIPTKMIKGNQNEQKRQLRNTIKTNKD